MKILLLAMLLVASAAGQFTTFPQATGTSSEITTYAADKTSATSWTVTGATHGLGTCDFAWALMDSSGNWIVPQSVACDGSYDVTITFGIAQAGRLVFVKAGGGSGGTGTPGGSDGQVQFNNSGAFGGSSGLAYNDTTKALGVIGSVTVGQTGTATGEFKMNGTTSGTVTLKPAAAAGTWTMTLPSTAGTSGYVLSTNGSGVMSWITPGGVASAAGTAGQIQVNEDGSALGARTLSTGLTMDGTTLGIDTTTVPTLGGTHTFTGTSTYSGTVQTSGVSSVADFSGASKQKERVASSAPSGSCEDGEHAAMAAGQRYHCISGTWYPDTATVIQYSATTQSAAIASGNLLASAPAGTYRVSAYIHTTTASAGVCTSSVTIGWTYNSASKTKNIVSSHSHAADETANDGSAVFRVGSGNITRAVDLTAGGDCSNAVFDIFITLERIG